MPLNTERPREPKPMNVGSCVDRSARVSCRQCKSTDEVYHITCWPLGDARGNGWMQYWCRRCERDAQRPLDVEGVVK